MKGRLIILGCGRSGTVYTQKRLQLAGLDFGHEKVQTDGGCGWTLALHNHPDSIVPTPDDIVFHQVRHPISTIGSLLTHTDGVWNWVEGAWPGKLPDNCVERCMWWWFTYNQFCERCARHTFQVECMDNDPYLMKVLSDRFGLYSLPQLPKSINSRKHDEVTWEILNKQNLPLADACYRLAEGYGYNPEEVL